MKERPIIFSGESVRAILDGRKTMTRRVITNIGGMKTFTITATVDGQEGEQVILPPIPIQEFIPRAINWGFTREKLARNCPYGKPGDRLWVRETFFYYPDVGAGVNKCGYRADIKPGDRDIVRWHPSIFMPRWASRLTLEITAVRVERLQDISMKDCLREGIDKTTEGNILLGSHLVYSFRELWNSINAKRGYSWEVNPWVWVLEYKVIP